MCPNKNVEKEGTPVFFWKTLNLLSLQKKLYKKSEAFFVRLFLFQMVFLKGHKENLPVLTKTKFLKGHQFSFGKPLFLLGYQFSSNKNTIFEGRGIPSTTQGFPEENWCPFLFYVFEGIQENLAFNHFKKKKSD